MPAVCAAQATDAVTVDPDVHRVVLENDFIRVFDARASRSAKSPMHTHPPMVLVSLDSTRFRMSLPDGKTAILDLDPGQDAWVEGAHHGWELLAGELHAIGVEIKSAQAGTVPPAPPRKANDAVTTDPDAHHVLFENPHVRVFEGRTSIGRRSPMHSHPPIGDGQPGLDAPQADAAGRQERRFMTSARARCSGSRRAASIPGKRSPAAAA